MVDFFLSQVSKLCLGVQLAEKSYDAVEPENDWESGSTTVASVQLVCDCRGFHLSRNHAKELLEERKVTLNWKPHQRPDLNWQQMICYQFVDMGVFGLTVLKTNQKNKIQF